MRTVSTSKVSSSLILKRRSSSRWGLSHWPQSSWHQSHSPGRLSSSEYDISYVHNSNIKRLQLNIYTKKPKLDHYYSSRVDYRFVESFLENSQLTWCIHSTVGDGRSSFHPRVHYTKMSSTREWRKSDTHDNSRDSSSSHIWWRLDRLKVNPKYRLIIFLKKDSAGPTLRSEGVGDGDDGGDDGGGLPDFYENKNPISYQLIICICLA